MKNIILLLLISSYALCNGQTDSSVRSEIEAATLKEQKAFKDGKCSEVLESMDDDISFLANGKKIPSKTIIEKFCNSISRPFKTPTVDKLDIYPLSGNSGYTIKTLEYTTDDSTKTQEFVTKVWQKTNGKWKISHLHSTVKKVPIN
jgi:ketosteroid isomerase-like protein|nr:nuclear transport factor 2 family protein [uncultured Psychroserpens sp.]